MAYVLAGPHSRAFFMENPSIHEANKVLRVLNGQKLKYTIRIHLPDNTVVEFQGDEKPALKFFDEARALWLFTGTYSTDTPIMKWIEGSILLVEENKV